VPGPGTERSIGEPKIGEFNFFGIANMGNLSAIRAEHCAWGRPHKKKEKKNNFDEKKSFSPVSLTLLMTPTPAAASAQPQQQLGDGAEARERQQQFQADQQQEQLRVDMERQAAAHQLASERSAAVRGAQLSTNEANVVAAAAREFLKSPSGDILAQRAHRNEKAEHLIDVIAIALNSTFSKYRG
jgi:hypothetical protein